MTALNEKIAQLESRNYIDERPRRKRVHLTMMNIEVPSIATLNLKK